RMDGIAVMVPGDIDQLPMIQIGCGAPAAQRHRGIGLAYMQRLGIVFGIDRQAGDIQLGCGPGQANGDFAAVGNQQTFERHQIHSCSSFFFTLPVAVMGRVSTSRTSGTLYTAMVWRHQSRSWSAVRPLPGRAMTKASGVSPRCSSGRPITAEARMPGCWPSMASSSLGNTLMPLTLSISLRRPR